MNRRHFGLGLVVFGIAASSGVGCSPASLGYLLRDSKQKPEYPLPPVKDKKEISVLVMVSKSSAMGADPMLATVDREIAGLMARTLTTDTKDDKHPIVCIDQSALEKWKSTARGDWKTMSPSVIGKQLGADYVIDVNLTSMTIFQAELAREFCQGRATVDITVYDTTQPDKILSQYPHNSHQPERSVASMPPNHYRRWFTERLAQELAWRHIPHDSTQRLARMN
jgi:hypothetical protein